MLGSRKAFVFAFITMLVGLLLQPVMAQSNDSERQEIVNELLQVLEYNRNLELVAKSISSEIINQVTTKFPRAPSAFLHEANKILREDSAKTFRYLIAIASRNMTNEFTISELRQLATFYRSAIGRKALHSLPRILNGLKTWKADEFGAFRINAAKRIETLAKKHGMNIHVR